jgi:fucose permease
LFCTVVGLFIFIAAAEVATFATFLFVAAAFGFLLVSHNFYSIFVTTTPHPSPFTGREP